MEILYRDKDIAVCIKPAGVLSEGASDDASTAPGMLSVLLQKEGERGEVFPVHRLDRETSGLIVYALNERAAASLSRVVSERKMQKEYIAAVHGKPDPESGEMRDLLYYDRQKNKVFTVKRERKGVKEASLSYSTVSHYEESGTSRVRVTLHTGRTHQIRVQFASRKMPLVGDRKYGAPAEDKCSLALRSVRLAFSHPRSGEKLDLEIE